MRVPRDERTACRVIDADRKSVRDRSTRDDDADLREKLRGLANQRRRFGYRRLHILLRLEGVMINRKKTQMLMAIATKSRDAKDVNVPRAALTALNRVENDHPLPLILYYRSFIAQRTKPSPVAIRGLVRATELAPFDFGLRMMLALQQLRDGKTDEARRSLTPISYNPHGGRLAAHARALLDRLGQGTQLAPTEALPSAPDDDTD